MMPAAKHGDPQMGVDIHLCVVPPSPSPVPLPTPHMSIVFDPFDYVPFIGATVTVCGMKRAVAGTEGKAVHIPPGFPFAPKIPDTSDEIFMGSATVNADGDPFSFLGVMVLACQVAGMPSPPRPKGRGKKLMLLPTVTNIAIPTNVFIGGPPTISLMGMASKIGFAALGKFMKSKLFAAMRRKVFGNMKPGFLKCVILRAEPVDVTTGEVVLQQKDAVLRSRIPLDWVRAYASGNPRVGACGVGWDTPADIRLEVHADGSAAMFRPALPATLFEATPARPGQDGAVLELWDGARWTDAGDEWQVRTKDGLVYHFPKRGRPAGETTEHLLSAITDASGNSLRFRRRGWQLEAVVEDAGRAIVLHWSGDRLVRVALQDPSGGEQVEATYAYTDAGDLHEVRDALGHPYRYAWDGHRLVRHTNRVGLSFYYQYEQFGDEWRVVRSWGDGGLYDYRFAWADAASTVRITNSLGHVSVLTLDNRGLPVSELDALGGVTTFEYDDVGRASAVTDQDGLRTAYEYDERGNVLRVTRPDGLASVVEFSTADRPVAITDEDGAVWRQDWDSRGLPVRHTTPLGHATCYEHDGRGHLVAMVTPRGGRWAFGYDEFGNLVSVRDPLGHVTTLGYDIRGLITRKTDPLGRVTTMAYDAAGRRVATVQPTGAGERLAYDAEGDLVSVVDQGGRETRCTRFGQGLISAVHQPDGTTVRYRYDTEEQLTGIVNARGEEHSLVRDALGRLIEEVDYWDQPTRYVLTPAGRVARRTDALSQVSTYDTDALGRITARTMPHPDAPGTPLVETYTYDPMGNLLAADNPWVSVARTFNRDGQLVREEAGGAVVAYDHDEAGNCTSLRATLPSGGEASATFRYDLADQVQAVSVGDLAATLERDPSGAIVAEQLGPALRRVLSYDAGGRLVQQVASAGRGIVAAQRYRYDATGDLLGRRDAVLGTDRFAYDPNGRVAGHTDPVGQVFRYGFDPAGDLLAPVRRDGPAFPSGAGATRQARHAGQAYLFDRTGALVRRDGAGAALMLRWDAGGRLHESEADGVAAAYRYDALGRRFEKASNGRRVRFFWAGDMLGGEWVDDGAGGPASARTFITYPGTFVPFACLDMADDGSRVALYQNDPNGAPTYLLSPGGDVLWSGRYDALGAFEGGPAPGGTDNPLRLQGQYRDAETGLHYNRHRYFDPCIGAYVSPDPLSFYAGSAPYQLGLNTLGWVDPLGLKKCNIDPKTVARLQANMPPGMVNPHMHHIVMEGKFSRWTRENRKFITEARTILRNHNIDIQGSHNVVWAENAGHSVVYAKAVRDKLAAAAQRKNPSEAIKRALARIGDELVAGTFPT